jgi:hypothetical protein
MKGTKERRKIKRNSTEKGGGRKIKKEEWAFSAKPAEKFKTAKISQHGLLIC